jgi:hypothetical protein
MQYYNFACCWIWVWNLVCHHIKGGILAEGIQNLGIEEDICA